MDAYTLADLQQYLQQYPAAHYSHNGKEPLLYTVVLLLSLQFRCAYGAGWEGRVGARAAWGCMGQAVWSSLAGPAHPLTPPAPPTAWRRGAVAFLGREAATKDYRLDAVHLAIALHHYAVLDTSAADAGARRQGAGAGRCCATLPPARFLRQDWTASPGLAPDLRHYPTPTPGAGRRGVDVGQLIHRYGKEFVYTDPALALEYYMLAADALGGSVQVSGAAAGTAARVWGTRPRALVLPQARRPAPRPQLTCLPAPTHHPPLPHPCRSRASCCASCWWRARPTATCWGRAAQVSLSDSERKLASTACAAAAGSTTPRITPPHPAPSPARAAGEGGALARFVPDAGERSRVLEAVAHECAASAQASAAA